MEIFGWMIKVHDRSIQESSTVGPDEAGALKMDSG